jgi:prophage antirepressor-like protein
VVRDLLAKGASLRDGLDEEAAADVLWVLNDAGLYHLLVHRRGWTPERFATWVADAMQRELLG